MNNHIRSISLTLPPASHLPARLHIIYRDGGTRDEEMFCDVNVRFGRSFPGLAEFNTALSAARNGTVTFDFSAGGDRDITHAPIGPTAEQLRAEVAAGGHPFTNDADWTPENGRATGKHG